MTTIRLEKQPDGSYIDWGRHWRLWGFRDASGPAQWYTGEAAKVLDMVLRYSRGAGK